MERAPVFFEEWNDEWKLVNVPWSALGCTPPVCPQFLSDLDNYIVCIHYFRHAARGSRSQIASRADP
jgi:hypothetical protein